MFIHIYIYCIYIYTMCNVCMYIYMLYYILCRYKWYIYICHHIPLYPTTCMVLYQRFCWESPSLQRPAWLPESLDVEDEDWEMKTWKGNRRFSQLNMGIPIKINPWNPSIDLGVDSGKFAGKHRWGFPWMEVPPNWWFIRENSLKTDNLGVPLLRKP